MSLHLNLLHEEISEQRQRQRDPLKLGMIALGSIGALLFLYYGWNAYRTLEIKGRLSAAQQDWAAVEPKVTAAQKKSAQLTETINTTRVLESMIDSRFFWGPFLDRVAHCVAPNNQLTSLEGTVSEDKSVTVGIEGVAAGREPRAVAEDLRQLLQEQLGKAYSGASVQFKTLEDIDTIVSLDGTSVPMARYVISVNLNGAPPASATPSPSPTRKAKP